MNMLLAIRIVEWLSLSMSTVGEAASLYAVASALRGLLVIPRTMRHPDHITLTQIAILSVLVGVIGHALFAALAVISLSGTPPAFRYRVALIQGTSFVLIQSLMVSASILIPILSRRLRT